MRTRRDLTDSGRFSLDEEFATARRSGYYPSEPADFAWLNIKAALDPMGTDLVGYHPDEHLKVWAGLIPLKPHVGVMKEPRTYAALVPYL